MTLPPRPKYPQTAAEQRAADQAYYRRVLQELDEVGAELARLRGKSPPAASQRPRGRSSEARAEILREVGHAIRRSSRHVDAESLYDELLDILDDAELEEELDEEFAEELDDDRPVADIIADICNDLGLVCRDLGLAPPPVPQPSSGRTPVSTQPPAVRTAKPRLTRESVVILPSPRERTGTAPPSGQPAGGAKVLDARDRFRRR
jgi:hypothetical protein